MRGGHLRRTVDPTNDPRWIEEYGYGMGPPTGILILKYVSDGALEIPRSRSDFLHQIYWTPEGMLSVRHGEHSEFIGSTEAFWVRRGVTHEVFAPRRQLVYRICLREVPDRLDAVRVAAVSVDDGVRARIEDIARPGVHEDDALRARAQIMAGLGVSRRDLESAEGAAEHSLSAGFAHTISAALLRDPADDTTLSEWAERLHTTTKTLQRDFQREYGESYSRWRTRLRLHAAAVLLETRAVSEVAYAVGYGSVPAFVAAFSREYGHTPGTHATRRRDSA